MDTPIITRETIIRRKAFGDGRILYRHARAVILLDASGEVVEIIHRPIGFLVNVVAIIGPHLVEDVLLNRVVRAEIGIGRTAPYTTSETRSPQGILHRTQKRNAYPLTEKEQSKLLPVIGKVIQKIIDVETSHRKRLTYFKNKKADSQVYLIGKWITIPAHLTLLTFACLAKDMATRKSGHLKEVVNRTWLKLSGAKSLSYTPKQLRRLKIAQYTASVFHDARYGVHVFNWIRESIGKCSEKERALFEQIIEVFKLEPTQERDSHYLALLEYFGRNTEQQILRNFPLRVMISQKRIERREKKKKPEYRHAKGCLRVEVMPSQEALEKHRERMCASA